jgi:hypothetical protein
MARWWKRPSSGAPAAFVDTVDAGPWWFADGEELAEGAVEDLLRTLGPTLAARGVIYDVATISAPETGRYTIAIDGEEVHLYDEASWSAGTDDHPWVASTIRPLRVLNRRLADADATERLHTLYAGGNEGIVVLTDPVHVAAYAANPGIDPGEIPVQPR